MFLLSHFRIKDTGLKGNFGGHHVVTEFLGKLGPIGIRLIGCDSVGQIEFLDSE